jgi:hypothetical protein
MWPGHVAENVMKNYKYLLILTALMVGAAVELAAPRASIAAIKRGDLPKKCRVVSAEGADATVVSTRKSVFLKSGTPLTLASPDMHQGYIAVKALIEGRSTTVSISAGDTNCLD